MDNTEVFIEYLNERKKTRANTNDAVSGAKPVGTRHANSRDDSEQAFDLTQAIEAFTVNITHLESLHHHMLGMNEMLIDIQLSCADWTMREGALFEKKWSRFIEERAQFIQKCGNFFAANASQPGEFGFIRLRLPNGHLMNLEAGKIGLGDGVVLLLRAEKPTNRQDVRHLGTICNHLLKEFQLQTQKMVQRHYWLQKHLKLVNVMTEQFNSDPDQSTDVTDMFNLPVPARASGLSNELLDCFESSPYA